MYRQSATGQLSFENFYLPFGGKLSGENRWVRLAELVPWEEFESEYAEQFSQGQGAPAKNFRMALGALIIKRPVGKQNGCLEWILSFLSVFKKHPNRSSIKPPHLT
jgi:IS5 family transposase